MNKIGQILLAFYAILNPGYNSTTPQKVGSVGFWVALACAILYIGGTILTNWPVPSGPVPVPSDVIEVVDVRPDVQDVTQVLDLGQPGPFVQEVSHE